MKNQIVSYLEISFFWVFCLVIYNPIKTQNLLHCGPLQVLKFVFLSLYRLQFHFSRVTGDHTSRRLDPIVQYTVPSLPFNWSIHMKIDFSQFNKTILTSQTCPNNLKSTLKSIIVCIYKTNHKNTNTNGSQICSQKNITAYNKLEGQPYLDFQFKKQLRIQSVLVEKNVNITAYQL